MYRLLCDWHLQCGAEKLFIVGLMVILCLEDGAIKQDDGLTGLVALEVLQVETVLPMKNCYVDSV